MTAQPILQRVLGWGLLSVLVGCTALAVQAFWPIAVGACGFGARAVGTVVRSTTGLGRLRRWVEALPLVLLASLTISLVPSLEGEPVSLLLLVIVTFEALLVWLPSHRRGLNLLGILLALHVLGLALPMTFPYYPILAPFSAAVLMGFWLSVFSYAFGRISPNGRSVRPGRLSRDRVDRPIPIAPGVPIRIVALLVCSALTLGLVLFFLFPRVRIELAVGGAETDDAAAVIRRVAPDSPGAPTHRSPSRQEAQVGYTETVSLRQKGPGAQDGTQLLMVECRDEDGAPASFLTSLLLRGSTLDVYENATWFRSPVRTKVTDARDGADGWAVVPRRAQPPGRIVHQEVSMRPVISNVVFALPVITAVKAPSIMVEVGDGSARFTETAHGSRRYEVVSRWISREDIRGAPITWVRPPERYTRLPRLSARVHQLAESLTANKTDLLARCEAIERYLQTNLIYSLDVDYSKSSDPVDELLFSRKAGYCVHFASAMLVMLRSLGIPCRMACGFASSEFGDTPGMFIVRRRNAHAWVEVRFGDRGWIAFDPSPVQDPGYLGAASTPFERFRGWLRYVTSFDEVERKRLLVDLWAGIPGWTVRVLAVLFLLWLAWRVSGRVGSRSRTTGGSALRTSMSFYDAFLTVLLRRGIRRRVSSTPLELAEEAKSIFPELPVDTITTLFCRARFGGKPLTGEELDRARKALQELDASR